MQFTNKSDWRKWALKQRSLLPIKALSQQISKTLMEWPTLLEAEHILSYRAFGSEFDISTLELSNNKSFYLTRTWGRSQNLTVHSANSPLEKHSFGYWQPKSNVPKIDPKLIDIALIPGLCFDLKGTRLGYGMGFYDRFLPSLREDTLLIGITTEVLLVASLPKDTFDVPMTHLITEKEILKNSM